jgi:hypothetical protein
MQAKTASKAVLEFRFLKNRVGKGISFLGQLLSACQQINGTVFNIPVGFTTGICINQIVSVISVQALSAVGSIIFFSEQIGIATKSDIGSAKGMILWHALVLMSLRQAGITLWSRPISDALCTANGDWKIRKICPYR